MLLPGHPPDIIDWRYAFPGRQPRLRTTRFPDIPHLILSTFTVREDRAVFPAERYFARDRPDPLVGRGPEPAEGITVEVLHNFHSSLPQAYSKTLAG